MHAIENAYTHRGNGYCQKLTKNKVLERISRKIESQTGKDRYFENIFSFTIKSEENNEISSFNGVLCRNFLVNPGILINKKNSLKRNCTLF